MGYVEILLIAGLIIINGFFVSVEFALVKVRATQIDQLAEQGNWAAKLTSKALDRLDFYLSASQIGITVASLALGRAMHDWVEPLVESGLRAAAHPRDSDRGFRHLDSDGNPYCADTCDVSCTWRLGEQAPKNLAIRAPRVVVLLTAPPLVILVVRVLAGDLALEQGQQPDALGARPGPDEHGRARSQRGRAASDRRRERGRRPPFAQ